MTEDDGRMSHALHALTDRQVPTGPVPLAQLLRRGRRARRLRTLTGTAAGAGGLALVCAATLALVPGTTVQPPPPSAARSAPATPSAAPSVVATTATPPVPASTAQLLELLRSKLPTNLQLSNPWQLDRTSGFPFKQLTAAYTASDGTGTGTVRIEVGRTRPSADGTVRPAPCDIPGCTVTTQPDGAFLTLYLPPEPQVANRTGRPPCYDPTGPWC
ncbi:hypothetical protein ACFQ0T_23055 [Kitasatospora gansuensis]